MMEQVHAEFEQTSDTMMFSFMQHAGAINAAIGNNTVSRDKVNDLITMGERLAEHHGHPVCSRIPRPGMINMDIGEDIDADGVWDRDELGQCVQELVAHTAIPPFVEEYLKDMSQGKKSMKTLQ